MRRFLASAWYPFLTAVILAGVTVAAFAMLSPTGEDVGNGNVVSAFKIVGWAIGPVMGVLALLKMIILNGIRRIVKLRKVAMRLKITFRKLNKSLRPFFKYLVVERNFHLCFGAKRFYLSILLTM